MQDDLAREQCVLCGTTAAVRVSGTSFCAACGLRQYTDGMSLAGSEQPKQRRRLAAIGLISSSFLFKAFLAAVAIAAVGGVAASTTHGPPPSTTGAAAAATSAPVTGATMARAERIVETTTTGTIAALQGDSGAVADSVDAAEAVAAAGEYAAAVGAWADCVAAAATMHSGGVFDPVEACGDEPEPGDVGLPDPGGADDGPAAAVDAPGHDEDGPGASEDAPGHDEDGPGASEDAPGHDEDGPGASEDAPGQDEDGPGASENAPGHNQGQEDLSS